MYSFEKPLPNKLRNIKTFKVRSGHFVQKEKLMKPCLAQVAWHIDGHSLGAQVSCNQLD